MIPPKKPSRALFRAVFRTGLMRVRITDRVPGAHDRDNHDRNVTAKANSIVNGAAEPVI